MIGKLLSGSILLLGLSLNSQLWAYDIPENTEEYENHRSSFSFDAGTSVDPFSGNVKLSATDLYVPGTAGLDISVRRSYNSTNKDNDSILGMGWKMNFGSLISEPDADFRVGNCNSRILVPKSLVLEISDQRVDFHIYDRGGANNQYHYISSNNWVAKCLQGGGLVAYSPNGLRYQLDVFDYIKDDKVDRWRVSKISDSHGNQISFKYNTTQRGYRAGVVAPNVMLESILPAGHSQYITFDNHLSGDLKGKLDKITFDGKTWDYEYENNSYDIGTIGDINTGSFSIVTKKVTTLTSVIRPDNRSWSFTYDPIPVYWKPSEGTFHTENGNGRVLQTHAYGFLTKKINPLGGKTEYEYDYFSPDGRDPLKQFYLRVKNAEKYDDNNATQGKWGFDYRLNVMPEGTLLYTMPWETSIDPRDETRWFNAEYYDQTTVTLPNSVEHEYVYHSAYNKKAYRSGSITHWKVGLPISESVSTDLLKKTFSWSNQSLPTSSEKISNIYHHGVRLSSYRAIQAQSVIQLRNVSYTTDYTDHDTFGNPKKITETGDNTKKKITDLEYENKTNLTSGDVWFVGLPKKQSVSDSTLQETHFIERTYHAHGKLKSLNEQGRVTRYEYHTDGNLHTAKRVSETDENDVQTTTYSNYYLGLPKTITEPGNITITQDYYPTGNLKSKQVFGPKTNENTYSNQVLSKVDYLYDDLGRIEKISPQYENAIDITYSSYQNTKTIERGDLSIIHYYDAFGRLVEIFEKDTNSNNISRADRNKAKVLKYDVFGRLEFESYKKHHQTAGINITEGVSYTYNELDELTKIKNTVDNSEKEIKYQNNNTIEKYDELDNKLTFKYQSYGNPFEKDLVSVTDADNNTTTIGRDVLGRMTSMTQDRLTRRWRYEGNDLRFAYRPESTGWTAYQYDGFGNLEYQSLPGFSYGAADGYINNRNGQYIVYEYDDRNRLSKKSYKSDIYGGYLTETLYYYSGLDEITKIDNTTDAITNEYVYDNTGKLELEKLTVDGYQFEFGYDYDANGALSENKYPNYPETPRIIYNPDAFGRTTVIDVLDGQNETVNNSLVTVSRYHPNDTIADIYLANQSYVINSQDTRRRLNSVIVYNAGSGAMLLNNRYTYDVANNLDIFKDNLDQHEIAFSYDHLNRVDSALSSAGMVDYDYDLKGNIELKPTKNASGSISYSYNTRNRLTSISGAKYNTFSHDRLGNIRFVGGDTSSRYFFDYLSNLRTSYDNQNRRSQYHYDGFDRRVKKIHAGKTTYYMYNRAGKLIMEYSPSLGEIRQYVYVAGQRHMKQEIHSNNLDFNSNGQSDAVDTGGNTSNIQNTMELVFYHHDPLGSTIAATAHDFSTNPPTPPNQLLWKERYEAFGEPTMATTSPLEDNIRYTGHYEDNESGLVYAGARYYDPSIGRFISMDPAGPVPNNIHSFNRYTYANNNPYKYVDPDGRNATLALGGILGESISFLKGDGFDGGMIIGAFFDGYDGEGAGFWSSAGEDALNFVGGGAVANISIKGLRLLKSLNLTRKIGNFADDAKLLSHFEKHGKEFGAKSAGEYLSIARSVMQEGIKVQYSYKGEIRTGFIKLIGNNRKGQAKFAFVGTNKQGQITTLHTKSGKDVWKTLNGNAKDKTIYPSQ